MERISFVYCGAQQSSCFMTIMSRPREIVLHMYVERERGRESERGSERASERERERERERENEGLENKSNFYFY